MDMLYKVGRKDSSVHVALFAFYSDARDFAQLLNETNGTADKNGAYVVKDHEQATASIA